MILLLLAAAAVAVLHAILPDHWVPLAVVARTQRWGPLRLARVSTLAAAGHVAASLILAAVVALIGLRFQALIVHDQGRIVGGLLIVTGLAFLVWGLIGARRGGHHHHHGDADHDHHHHHGEDHDHHHQHQHPVEQGSLAARLAAVAVPFGVAASPDLTILPVALASAAYGGLAILGTLIVFAVVTLVVFVVLTVGAAVVGYQIKGEWLERNAVVVSAVVLIAIGIVAFVGL